MSEESQGITVIGTKTFKDHLTVAKTIRRYKGIGHNFSRFLLRYLNLPEMVALKGLNQSDRAKLSALLDHKIVDGSMIDSPEFLHYCNDANEGLHFLDDRLKTKTQYDINRKKRDHTVQGVRHIRGQKVRNQRTKTTGRSRKRGGL